MKRKVILLVSIIYFINSFGNYTICQNSDVKSIKHKGQRYRYKITNNFDTENCLIRGCCYDLISGNSLPYLIVTVHDSIGTQADENGNFEFEVNPGKCIIRFYSVGYGEYKTKKFVLKRKDILDIWLFLKADLI